MNGICVAGLGFLRRVLSCGDTGRCVMRARLLAGGGAAMVATCGAVAQISVPVTSNLPGLGFPASPLAAYSALSFPANNVSQAVSGGPASDVLFDDIAVATSTQGQIIRQVRIPFVNTSSNPPPPFSNGERPVRFQVGFWNADGPGGLAGTPIQGLTGLAQYRSTVFTAPFGGGLATLDLGNAGFVVPSGRFYVGLSLEAISLPNLEGYFNLLASNPSGPTVGSSLPGWTFGNSNGVPGSAPMSGVPWGQTLGLAGGPAMNNFFVGSGALCVELVIPAPSVVIPTLGFAAALANRRRRS
jgi:hypothetical protein